MNNICRISSFYPSYFMDKLISYVGLRLTNHFNDVNGLEADIWGLCHDKSIVSYMKKTGRPILHDSVNPLLWPVYRRIFSDRKLVAMAEKKYLKQLNPGDIAYLWPGVSLDVYKKAREKGCIIITERINTLRGNSKKLQDQECKAIGVTPCHGITEESVELENHKMALCDYIFSPAPGITDSLRDIGIPLEKIIETSYAMRHNDILDPKPEQDYESDFLRVIFVGSIDVRKGIHLLLSAWQNSGIRGELTVVGRVSPEVSQIFYDYLAGNSSIRHMDYVNDLKPVYRKADLMALTSIEEGSPLVTYLAYGASVPVVVSPMGAGGIVEDGVEGIIVDPHVEDSIIQALKKFAEDRAFRKRASLAARQSGLKYTWDLVARRRAEELLNRINEKNQACG